MGNDDLCLVGLWRLNKELWALFNFWNGARSEFLCPEHGPVLVDVIRSVRMDSSKASPNCPEWARLGLSPTEPSFTLNLKDEKLGLAVRTMYLFFSFFHFCRRTKPSFMSLEMNCQQLNPLIIHKLPKEGKKNSKLRRLKLLIVHLQTWLLSSVPTLTLP